MRRGCREYRVSRGSYARRPESKQEEVPCSYVLVREVISFPARSAISAPRTQSAQSSPSIARDNRLSPARFLLSNLSSFFSSPRRSTFRILSRRRAFFTRSSARTADARSGPRVATLAVRNFENCRQFGAENGKRTDEAAGSRRFTRFS